MEPEFRNSQALRLLTQHTAEKFDADADIKYLVTESMPFLWTEKQVRMWGPASSRKSLACEPLESGELFVLDDVSNLAAWYVTKYGSLPEYPHHNVSYRHRQK